MARVCFFPNFDVYQHILYFASHDLHLREIFSFKSVCKYGNITKEVNFSGKSMEKGEFGVGAE